MGAEARGLEGRIEAPWPCRRARARDALNLLSDPWFYAAAIPAVILLGLAKGGFSGAGALSVPLLALVMPPVEAAAIVLPVLVVQDVVGVWAFRRSWDGRVLAWALPGAGVGIAVGYWFAAALSAQAVLLTVGLVSLLYGTWQLFRRWLGHEPVARRLPGWAGSLLGIASGFTSQVAHAGQPPFQLWVLPMRLERDVLVGTTAIYFAIINWAKVPAYWALGQFDATNLWAAVVLMPLAIASTFAGVWLVRRVSADRFYAAIYVLMILLGVLLLWEASR